MCCWWKYPYLVLAYVFWSSCLLCTCSSEAQDDLTATSFTSSGFDNVPVWSWCGVRWNWYVVCSELSPPSSSSPMSPLIQRTLWVSSFLASYIVLYSCSVTHALSCWCSMVALSKCSLLIWRPRGEREKVSFKLSISSKMQRTLQSYRKRVKSAGWVTMTKMVLRVNKRMEASSNNALIWQRWMVHSRLHLSMSMISNLDESCLKWRRSSEQFMK